MLLLKLRDFVQSRFYNSDDEKRRRISLWLLGISQRVAFMIGLFSNNLSLLALLCGTDKVGGHSYAPVYQKLFSRLRWKKISILEIGVGGYSWHTGGRSLKMWQAFFRRGAIYGVDVYDKTALSRWRIKVYQCSQDDDQGLDALTAQLGPFDIIIDDGSHINAHQIKSFKVLFPHLKDGGVYAIEDVQTSYWPIAGGGPLHSDAYRKSCMHFFKQRVDSVNIPEFLEYRSDDTTLDLSVGSISFYHNLIVITKDNAPRRANFNLKDPAVRERLFRQFDQDTWIHAKTDIDFDSKRDRSRSG